VKTLIDNFDGKGKKPLKQILLKHFDREFIHRKKTGFALPFSIYFTHEQKRKTIQDILLQPGAFYSNYLDTRIIENKFNKQTKSFGDYQMLWSVLVLEIWMQQNQTISFS
jgi:asparagine synthase (glutamine-hydrolysing)